jgi:hypothetical protein
MSVMPPTLPPPRGGADGSGAGPFGFGSVAAPANKTAYHGFPIIPRRRTNSETSVAPAAVIEAIVIFSFSSHFYVFYAFRPEKRQIHLAQ